MPRNKGLKGGVMRAERIREIQRLVEAGYGQREIHRATRIARSTIQEYMLRLEVTRISYAESRELTDDELLKRLCKNGPGRRKEEVANAPDFASISRDYGMRKGVTLELLWKEWVEATGGGYGYQTFCRRYRAWQSSAEVVMHREYAPGEVVLLDYAGEVLSWFGPNNEEHEVEIFVAVLGASNLIYAEATASQSLLHWVGSSCRMFEYFGGTTEAVVIDNLKSGVNKADRYEPDINRTYQEFAAHYGTTVFPVRANKPRDKGKVEQAVQHVERWILAPLRKRIFTSIGEINDAIRKLLTSVNEKLLTGYEVSRKELFETSEKSHLHPLPPVTYQPALWKIATVHLDYHVAFEKHFYSVPFKLVREAVWIRRTEKLIEIFHNNTRVASHPISYAKNRFTTDPAHMPPHHLSQINYSAELFLEWGSKCGEQTKTLVARLLEAPQYKQQSYRSILGLQRLEKKYGRERLEQAAATANRGGYVSQRFVRMLLEQDTKNDAPNLLTHNNLRGPEYFH